MNQADTIYSQTWISPVGEIFLYSNNTHLVALTYPANNPRFLKTLKTTPLQKTTKVIEMTKKQLREYFKGQRQSFEIPLQPSGTEFQKKAWMALSQIPFGQTSTYAAQANRIKATQAVRAVGTANGRNPLSIVVPCHRVIGSNGKLSGYAGGLQIKQALLDLERGELVR